MIDSAKIGYGISLLGEAILREGFLMEKRNAEKTETSLPHDGVSESYRPKKLLL